MNNLRRAWEKSFTEKPYQIGLHALFWIIYFLVLKIAGYYLLSQWKIQSDALWAHEIVSLYTCDPVVIIMFYLTLFFVYKNLIEEKKYLFSILGLLFCLFVYTQLFYFSQKWLVAILLKKGYSISEMGMQNSVEKYSFMEFMSQPVMWISSSVTYALYMLIPMGGKFFRDQSRLQTKQTLLEKQNLQLEMGFLKAQIHPHFLFNTLNNIYSLIIDHESKKSGEMVSGLSSLLRYALYEGKSEFILLEKEIGMLKDFIALEEVRSDDINLEVQFPKNITAVKIPPFLLLPLVENAFKHGVNSQLKQSCVKIELHINEELSLQVQNTFDDEFRKKNSGGFGLLNLKKRLDYYYENNYFLGTIEKENIFTATLKLPLSCPKLNA